MWSVGKCGVAIFVVMSDERPGRLCSRCNRSDRLDDMLERENTDV